MANNTWNGYHWANGSPDSHSGPISLTLVNHLTSDYAYTAVLSDWDGNGGPLTLASSDVGGGAIKCNNGTLGEIHVCNYEYGEIGWLGLAQIWISPDGHIDAGVALMNDSYMFDTGSVYDDPAARRHVLCQEIGHTFGLDHQGSPKKKSCMNNRWGLTNPDFQSPNPHDYATLNEIYGSGNGGDEGGPKPCNPRSKKCANGANVHYAARPGGGWVVTFTIPAGGALR